MKQEPKPNIRKAQPGDHSTLSTKERQQRFSDSVKKEGGSRLSGWLDAAHTKYLNSLIQSGYADTKIGVVQRSIDEAFGRNERKLK
jgi:hypothetical protein